MAAGGFDAVIGNPPYVRQETLGVQFKDYVKERFASYSGTADIYVFFLEKGHILLKSDGMFGVICANRFMRTDYGKNIRKYLAEKTELLKLIDFGELKVFQDASTFPLIILFRKRETDLQSPIYAPIKSLSFNPSLDATIEELGESLPSEAIDGDRWTLTSKNESGILAKMSEIGIPLNKYINGKILVGLKTGLNSAFVIDVYARENYIATSPNCEEIIKPFVVGDDIRKYHIRGKKRYLILIPKGWTNQHKNRENAWQWLNTTYPSIANHLKNYQKDAEKRSDQGDYWWELRACDYYEKIEVAKIIYPEMAKEPRFAFDDQGNYSNNKTFFIPRRDPYLLGLLNSKLLWLYFKRHCSCLGDPDHGGRLELRESYMMKIPIRPIDPSNPDDVAKHDRMVALVETMLDLHRRRPAAATDHEKNLITRQIEATDKQIDGLVYELYGLTDEEIRIVEGGGT